MTNRDLVLVGGGGHAKACLDVIRAEGRFRVVGIVDKAELLGTTVLGVPVIGTDDELAALTARGLNFLVALGQIRTPAPRKRLYTLLKRLGATLPTIIAPTAHVSADAVVGEGSIIMHLAVVGPEVQIGANCIINNHVSVEHGTAIGNHCHISTGVKVNGECVIEDDVFIGSGSVIKQRTRIGRGNVISMGSVITKDMLE